MVKVFVPVWQKTENKGGEMWMYTGGGWGEKKELFKIAARKSVFQSAWLQWDQFSISVSLPFMFQNTCIPLEMGDLPAAVCLKQIVSVGIFSRWTASWINLMRCEEDVGRTSRTLLLKNHMYTTAAPSTSLVSLLSLVRCEEQTEPGPCFLDPFIVTWSAECERENAPDTVEWLDFKQPCRVSVHISVGSLINNSPALLSDVWWMAIQDQLLLIINPANWRLHCVNQWNSFHATHTHENVVQKV